MIVIWGKYKNQTCLGKVADRCQWCRTPQTFEIVQHREAFHIFFLPFSGWVPVSTSKQCSLCKREASCDVKHYHRIASLTEELSFEELVQMTNPRLLASMRSDAAKELLVGDSELPAETNDPVLQKLLVLLDKHDARNPEHFALREKLKHWKRLRQSQKAALKEEVHEFCRKQFRVAKAKKFLLEIGKANPSHLSKVGCIAMLGFCFTSYPVSHLLPGRIDMIWLVAYYVVWCFVSLFVYAGVAKVLGMLWIKYSVLSEAEAAGVAPDEMLLALRSFDSWSNEDKVAFDGFTEVKDDLFAYLTSASHQQPNRPRRQES